MDLLSFFAINNSVIIYDKVQMEEILTKSSGHVSFVGLNNCKDDFATWWTGFMEGRTPGSGIQEG
jgi:hypothetical protein